MSAQLQSFAPVFSMSQLKPHSSHLSNDGDNLPSTTAYYQQRRRGPEEVKRNLFNNKPSDKKETSQFLKKEMTQIQEEKMKLWGYNFVSGKPVLNNEKYQWEELSEAAVPNLYKTQEISDGSPCAKIPVNESVTPPQPSRSSTKKSRSKMAKRLPALAASNVKRNLNSDFNEVLEHKKDIPSSSLSSVTDKCDETTASSSQALPIANKIEESTDEDLPHVITIKTKAVNPQIHDMLRIKKRPRASSHNSSSTSDEDQCSSSSSSQANSRQLKRRKQEREDV